MLTSRGQDGTSPQRGWAMALVSSHIEPVRRKVLWWCNDVARLRIHRQRRFDQAVEAVDLTLGYLLGETSTNRWMLSVPFASSSIREPKTRSVEYGTTEEVPQPRVPH